MNQESGLTVMMRSNGYIVLNHGWCIRAGIPNVGSGLSYYD